MPDPKPQHDISTPPSVDAWWTVSTLSEPVVSINVKARTAWDAHILARLGAFSAVECRITKEPKA